MQTSAAEVLKPVADTIQLIPVDKIDPSPFNARKEFPKEYLAELGASIARDGQQQPGKVRSMPGGRFQLVFGECRWRGAKLAGVAEYKAVVEAMDDAKAERLCLIENIKRRDLSVFEEAEKLKRLHEVHKVKVDDLALQVGLAARTVRENIKLATLEPKVRELVDGGRVSLSNAKLISRVRKEDQLELARRWGMANHDSLERHIRETYMVDLRQAPFALNLKGFPCLAETCDACPRNAKNLKDEYPDLKGANICTSPSDYRKKADLFAKAVIRDAEKLGVEVLEGKEAADAVAGHGAKYVPLNQETWVGDDRKTFAAVLPAKARTELKRIVARDDEGNLVELAERSELKAAFTKAGKKTIANSYELTGRHSAPSSGGGTSYRSEQNNRRKKLELRRAAAVIAIEQLANHRHTVAADDAFMQTMVGCYAANDYGQQWRFLAKQLDPDAKREIGGAAIRKHAAGLKGVELRKFTMRVAMASAMEGGGTWSSSHARELQMGMKLNGLDLAKCDAEAKKAKDAAKAAKKKPAPKAAAKKKGGAR